MALRGSALNTSRGETPALWPWDEHPLTLSSQPQKSVLITGDGKTVRRRYGNTAVEPHRAHFFGGKKDKGKY